MKPKNKKSEAENTLKIQKNTKISLNTPIIEKTVEYDSWADVQEKPKSSHFEAAYDPWESKEMISKTEDQ